MSPHDGTRRSRHERTADRRFALVAALLALLAAEAAVTVILIVLEVASLSDGLKLYAGLTTVPAGLLAVSFDYYFRRRGR